MALQICMIVAIGGAYYNEYNDKWKELATTLKVSNTSSANYTTPPTVDINYSPSGRMWYVIVCGYVTPILGIIMFFVVCHYWTQQFPIDVILDILKSLKSSIKKAVLLKKVGEEYVETLEKLSNILMNINLEIISILRILIFCTSLVILLIGLFISCSAICILLC